MFVGVMVGNKKSGRLDEDGRSDFCVSYGRLLNRLDG